MYLSWMECDGGRIKCVTLCYVLSTFTPNAFKIACKVWFWHVEHSRAHQSQFRQPYLSGNITDTINECINGRMYWSEYLAAIWKCQFWGTVLPRWSSVILEVLINSRNARNSVFEGNVLSISIYCLLTDWARHWIQTADLSFYILPCQSSLCMKAWKYLA